MTIHCVSKRVPDVTDCLKLWFQRLCQCVDGSVTVWMGDTVNVMNLIVVNVVYFCDAW